MRERLELRYNQIWKIVVGLLAVLGVAAAPLFLSLTTNLIAFLASAFVAGAICLSVGLSYERPTAELIHIVPRWAGLGGLTALAISGYAAAAGLNTLILLGLIIASSPPVVARVRSARPAESTKPAGGRRSVTARTTRTRPDPPQPPLIDFPVRPYLFAVRQTLAELTDAKLCLAWRRSFRQLQVAAGGERRIVMADVRRAYLDELERRRPAAFAAWLESGARAAGDPGKFFIPHTN